MTELTGAILRAAAVAADMCDKRRARVLAQPEIAKRLTQPPLRYSKPEVWNGYVPPATWREQTNNSPQRAALMQILSDVAAAEIEQEKNEEAPF